jgi:hypothetical protein
VGAGCRRPAKMLDLQRRLTSGERTMLNFPNQSRFFDPTRRAVRFWGYDSAMEWSFFVSEDALQRIEPDTGRDEAGLLKAFDSNRPLIYAAALKAFTRGRKGSYELAVTDF